MAATSPVTASSRRRLRKLLEGQKAAALEEALSSGAVDPQRLESLESLQKLADMTEQRNYTLLAAVVAATVLLVAFLVFFPIPTTEIELEAKTSYARLRLTDSQVVLQEAPELRALAISGLAAVRLPEGMGTDGKPAGGLDLEESSLRLEAITAAGAPASLRLADSKAAPDSLVALAAGRGGDYRVSFKADPPLLKVNLYGRIRVQVPGVTDQVIEFSRPKLLLAKAGSEPVDLDLALIDRARAGLPSRLSVRELSLFRSEKVGDAGQARVQDTSGLKAGRIYLISLSGAQRDLRENEELRLERPEGEVRSVHLTDDGIAFRFRGKVRDLTAGSLENPEPLMPTLLDWWKARQPASLFMGTTISLIGLILGGLRWFKVHL